MAFDPNSRYDPDARILHIELNEVGAGYALAEIGTAVNFALAELDQSAYDLENGLTRQLHVGIRYIGRVTLAAMD